MVRYLLLLALTAGSAPVEAQNARPEMELHIDGRNVVHGLPQQLRFTLRNMSDHDIHLPEPMLGCSDNRGSSVVKLVVKFVSQKGAAPAVQGGCVEDFGGPREGILAQARSWVVLRSGGYLERTAEAKQMSLFDQGAGSYEITAEYLPPAFSSADQRLLSGAGIEYPHKKLLSEKVVFRKNQ